AEELQFTELFIADEDLCKTEGNEFYIRDLIGSRVIEKNDGKSIELGTLTDVIQNTTQDIYVIGSDGKKDILIPVISEFIKKIDIETKTIEIETIPGLIDDDFLSEQDDAD
ncbi:MAG: 16S rRNA processing protein RimM, partial [Enterococcus sp.]|nr:16S rRNA processing protein RimM [Enterococcus sp.]